MKLARVGVGILVLSASFAGAAAWADGDNGPDVYLRSTPAQVPGLDGAAVTRANAVLGSEASKAPTRLASSPAELQVPPGATSYRDGVWHIGAKKLGMVRIFEYAKPVDVSSRAWTMNRTVESKSEPLLEKYTYAAVGVREVAVFMNQAGKVVSVMPTAYDRLDGADFTKGSAIQGETN
jgi:hypothetical protein